MLDVNRHSATKCLNKLCEAELTQPVESDDPMTVELTDQGRTVLAELARAIEGKSGSRARVRRPRQLGLGQIPLPDLDGTVNST